MSRPLDLISFFRRSYADVAGMDIGASGVKVVRLIRAHEQIKVMAADLLPALSLKEPPSAFSLPKPLKPRYMALACSTPEAAIKLLSVPAHSDKSLDVQISELMGLSDGAADVRLGYEVVQETRAESRVLAVVFPGSTARAMCGLFPEGVPAPCSVEVSGLASMTAFSHGPGQRHAEDCTAVIDFGAAVTILAFFNKGVMVMIRKFDFGTANIIKKLQDNLGVDREVATGILGDDSFDVSRLIHQAMESFLQQLTISCDFVERRENVRLKALFVCGGGVTIRLWAQEIETATGHKPVAWNPFEGLPMADQAFPESLKGQESRFAAALGAALAMISSG